MDRKCHGLTIRKVREIVQEDCFDNWDYYQSYDLNELIDRVDGGFGILNLKEE